VGLFGGDDKKKKQSGNEGSQRGTQRRSRRIVTPGAKGGSGSGSSSGSGSAAVRQRRRGASGQSKAPSSRREVKPQQKQGGEAPQAPQVPPPPSQQQAPPAAQPDELDLGDGLDLGGPSVPPPPSGPSISKGAGKQPITASDELEFSGSLDSDAGGDGPSRTGDAPLLEFLVSKAKLLSADQADQAKQKAQGEHLPIDVACAQLDFVDEEQLVNALTQECWVPHLKVDKYEIRKKALETVGEADARRHSVLPVDKLGSILNLAMVNPLDLDTIQDLENKTGLDIKKVVATRSEIEQGIAKYYGGGVRAKEGSLQIAQDRESARVTQMLSKAPSSPSSPSSPSKPSEGMPEITAAPTNSNPSPAPAAASESASDVADIDDLLSGDEEIAPSIVEPITIGDDELEPEDDSDPFLSDTEEAEPPQPVAEPSSNVTPTLEPELDLDADDALEPSISPAGATSGEGGLDLDAPPPPPASSPAPASEKPAEPAVPPPAPAARAPSPAAPAKQPAAAVSRPAKAGVVNLVPVMEEEFQHAITHGKSRIFEKWVSLQTRNRILNAVKVENELEPLLASLQGHGVKVEAS